MVTQMVIKFFGFGSFGNVRISFAIIPEFVNSAQLSLMQRLTTFYYKELLQKRCFEVIQYFLIIQIVVYISLGWRRCEPDVSVPWADSALCPSHRQETVKPLCVWIYDVHAARRGICATARWLPKTMIKLNSYTIQHKIKYQNSQ
jgi:hypothetical protein